MGKTVYTKLIVTALVTSFAFGGFAALNFYIFRELIPHAPTGNRIIYIRPENGVPPPPHIRAGQPAGNFIRPPFPMSIATSRELFILKNSLFITGAMLLVWLINIVLLLVIDRMHGKSVKRKLLRYGGSYVLIGLLLTGLLYLGAPDQHFQKIIGTNMPVHLPPTPTYRLRFDWGQLPFMTAIVINTIVLAILELILVQNHKSEIELENTRLKMSNLLARHQHLQHQLQPHFLFNSLNTLKSLIRTSPAGAEDYLLRLSFFLRSSLTTNELGLIPLADEVQLCRYYLEMQKIRYGNAFNYVMEIPDEVITAAQVPALTLQLLVENAIKHNTNCGYR